MKVSRGSSNIIAWTLRNLLIVTTFFAFTGWVAAQDIECTVLGSFWTLNSEQRTSNYLIGEVSFGADESGTKGFNDADSGVPIQVELTKSPVLSKGPKKISIEITFNGRDEEQASASSFYDKNWKGLAVSRNIKVKENIYTYTFSCRPGKKIR